MTITIEKELAATLKGRGKIHRVQRIGDKFLVLCRGFAPLTKDELEFTDSKPDCKICLNLKER